MAKKSRYAAVRQEIDDMRAGGATIRQIHRELLKRGFDSNYRSLWEYIQRMGNPEIRPAPRCRECGHFRVYTSAIKKGGHTYICKKASAEIALHSITSPIWCPRRENDEGKRKHENSID